MVGIQPQFPQLLLRLGPQQQIQPQLLLIPQRRENYAPSNKFAELSTSAAAVVHRLFLQT